MDASTPSIEHTGSPNRTSTSQPRKSTPPCLPDFSRRMSSNEATRSAAVVASLFIATKRSVCGPWQQILEILIPDSVGPVEGVQILIGVLKPVRSDGP